MPSLLPDAAWPLQRRCETIARLWALQYAALQLTLLRDHGEPALTEFKYRILRMHQKAHFLDGVAKLGPLRFLGRGRFDRLLAVAPDVRLGGPVGEVDPERLVSEVADAVVAEEVGIGEHGDASLVGVVDARCDPQQRALARSVRADEAERAAALEDEVDSGEHLAPAPPKAVGEAPADAGELDHFDGRRPDVDGDERLVEHGTRTYVLTEA